MTKELIGGTSALIMSRMAEIHQHADAALSDYPATPPAPSAEVWKFFQAVADGFEGEIKHGCCVVENPMATPEAIALGGVNPNLVLEAMHILSSGLVAPAREGAPDAFLVDGRVEQGLFFDRKSAEIMADVNCGTVVPLYRFLHRGAKESDGGTEGRAECNLVSADTDSDRGSPVSSSTIAGIKPGPSDPILNALIERARNHVMTPEEIYEQKRSFARGMCPFDRDYGKWCKEVDRLMPPLGLRGVAEQEGNKNG